MLHTSFIVLTGGGRAQLFFLLRAVLTDRWVASYQVGFGPLLLRAASVFAPLPPLSAIEKLGIHLERCVVPEVERAALARRFRAELVRREGPIEAEALDAASPTVFDLSVRLHTPSSAPPGLAARMAQAGVAELPIDTPPEPLSARLWLHLHDPEGRRLLAEPAVAANAADLDHPIALELRTEPALRWVFERWLVDLEGRNPDIRVVDLGEPLAHAKTRR